MILLLDNCHPRQKSVAVKINELVRHGVVAFALAALLYVVTYRWIQYRREFRGPWVVTFQSDTNGTPSVVVSQPALNIADQKIIFADQKVSDTNIMRTYRYDGPKTNASFGEVVFQDPTFLPGTITFNFWGHGVELMPRTMVIDQQEIPWHSQTNMVLTGPGKFERRKVKKPIFN
ncbi:MAG: hypothetical protein JWM68_4222 [Verrucomicrobiales bacterium]|nr:hypothetical protein [Verrucomicrobiales bacterium]